MNDLLGGGTRYAPSDRGGGDIEMGAPGPADAAGDAGMSQFFQEVADIKTQMATMKRSIQKLKETNEEGKKVTRAKDMKGISAQMQKDIDDILRLAKDLKERVKALDQANVESRKKQGGGEGTAADRTRMSITANLKKKLKENADEFVAMRTKFQEEYKDVVERRYYTVTGHKPDEETLEELIDTGRGDQIFKEAVQDQGRGQILDTVAEIQERHDSVKDVERSLLNLHQMFLDMAVLVEKQGEQLDNIEAQVNKAVEYIQGGTKQLAKAKSLQRNTRKWMCCGIMILLIVIAVVVVAVVKPWQIGKA